MRVETRVKEVLQETPKVRLVRLTWDDAFEFPFKPGQWVGVWCEDFLDEKNRPVRRAFSIASKRGAPHVELCVARGQFFSKHLQDLSPGSKVMIDGPFGMFWVKPDHDDLLFIAGGTGIAPFRPMIHQALKDKKKVTLVFSMKTPSDFIYKDELEGLQDDDNFNLVTTITGDNDFPAWEGKRGRVTTFLKDVARDDQAAYICGPNAFIEAVEGELVKLGLPKERIILDKWE